MLLEKYLNSIFQFNSIQFKACLLESLYRNMIIILFPDRVDNMRIISSSGSEAKQ